MPLKPSLYKAKTKTLKLKNMYYLSKVLTESQAAFRHSVQADNNYTQLQILGNSNSYHYR